MPHNTHNHAKLFADRLRSALKAAGIRASATVVADQFNLRYHGKEGISSHAARNWLMGISIPKPDKLKVLALWLKTTPEALLFGTRPSLPACDVANEPHVNLVDQRLISRYFMLMPEHRRVVREVVEGLYALSDEAKAHMHCEVRQ
jgi:transcriptional regulator with XRE-family HTH domain